MTPNLSAFLWVLRHCEGTAGPNGYRMHFGGQLFEGFADHPRVVVERGRYRSTAAGAYQILSRTWDWFISKNGPHDFSPDNQDLCARWLIDQRKATGDIEAGRFDEAIAKCNKEWASLPGSPYGQPTRTLEYCRAKYLEHGGAFSEITQPIEQIEESSQNVATNPVPELGTPVPEVGTPTEKPMGVFGLALLQSLLPAIPQLFGVLGKNAEKAEKNTKVAQIVVDTALTTLGAVNEQDALEKLEANPAQVKTVAAAVLSQPFISALVEIGAGAKGAQDEYAAIVKDLDDDEWYRMPLKFLFNPIHWVTGMFLFYVQQFIPPLTEKVKSLDNAAAISLIVIVFGVIAIVSGRWMGTYNKSKDE